MVVRPCGWLSARTRRPSGCSPRPIWWSRDRPGYGSFWSGYGFGDVVHISAVGFVEGATGTIEEVALRTTRLRTPNGEVVIVPNGQIVQVTNLSRDWARAVVDVPLPVGVDVGQASELLRKVGSEAFEGENLRPLLLKEPTVMGAESLEVGQINLRMVARELRTRVAVAFQREGLVAPAESVTDPDPKGA
jgi:moderate conductance mechanosensitive channel